MEWGKWDIIVVYGNKLYEREIPFEYFVVNLVTCNEMLGSHSVNSLMDFLSNRYLLITMAFDILDTSTIIMDNIIGTQWHAYPNYIAGTH